MLPTVFLHAGLSSSFCTSAHKVSTPVLVLKQAENKLTPGIPGLITPIPIKERQFTFDAFLVDFLGQLELDFRKSISPPEILAFERLELVLGLGLVATAGVAGFGVGPDYNLLLVPFALFFAAAT